MKAERDPIPERMREIRNSLGWTQGQLAQKMGVGKNSIINYEAGKVHPPSTVLRKFLLVTKASPAYLFDLTETQFSKNPNARQTVIKAYIQCQNSLRMVRDATNKMREVFEELEI